MNPRFCCYDTEGVAAVAFVILLLAPLGLVAAPTAVTFHVATNGNDAWSGRLTNPNRARTDGPLASLAGARDRVRSQKGQIQGHRVQVLLQAPVGKKVSWPVSRDKTAPGLILGTRTS